MAVTRAQFIQPPTLVDTVADRLRNMLHRMQIEPGERIAIDRLAVQFGVSQTPVREALSRIESEGLVHRIPNSGYRAATELTPVQIKDIFELRLLLEVQATRRATAAMSQDVRDRMSKIRDASTEICNFEGEIPFAEFIALDATFHRLIATENGNSFMAEILNRIYAHFHLLRRHVAPESMRLSLLEQIDVIDAMIANDADAAASAMEAHIQQSFARANQSLDSEPAAEQQSA